ncbi:MAG: response regulator transcription factor [Chloroflexota bacterium]|nr:response regulator transcription factor [Chloroflexota bacterium]
MRILLADDQAKVRSALRLLLEQEPDIDVLGEAVDMQGLMDWVKVVHPDAILIDWELPGLSDNGMVPELRSICPHLLVVALSGKSEARQEALDAGVDAFVSKGDPPERLLAALNDCFHKYKQPKG